MPLAALGRDLAHHEYARLARMMVLLIMLSTSAIDIWLPMAMVAWSNLY